MDLEKDPVAFIRCPTCGARVGHPCVATLGFRPVKTHKSRIERLNDPSWQILPPCTNKMRVHKGCLNCGTLPSVLELTEEFYDCGMHMACLTQRDYDRIIYRNEAYCTDEDGNNVLVVALAEKLAAEDPDHDWRISSITPLHDEEWQRQNGRWILVKKGRGYA